ncbi:MAG: DNA cytosine methyltransferase, partial [Oscillospiraceae bacterium]|nr:DNA cytosine methyltransferase [Oscillospiraceae bacterium]
MKNLTLGSLFSGSGGFELAGILAGITPIWNSEIEPYPILVTHNRLPNVQHFGDVSKLNGAALPPVDVVTFGSPCQDMSVAGKRNGLDGSRSGLFHEAVRIIREMRCATNGEYPRFIVWENVEGAYSSNNGEDFRTVLEEICQIKESDIFIPRPPDKWTKSGEIMGENFSVAWRMLDAQYFGVPQRRKRIYLVADFDGQRAGNILFESEGLSGYSAESVRTWQRTAFRAEKSTRTAGENICLCDQGGERIDVLNDKTATLRAEAHHPPCVLESAGFCTEHSAKSRSIGYESEKSPTLRAGVVPATITLENHPADSRIKISDDNICQTLTSRCGTGGGNVPLLMETPKVYGICAKHSNAMLSDNPHSGFYEAETSRTLDTSNQSPVKNQGGMVVIEGNGSRPSHQGNGYKESEIMYTLNTVEVPAVAMAESTFSISRDNHFSVSEDVAGTAVARGPATVVHSNGEHYST